MEHHIPKTSYIKKSLYMNIHYWDVLEETERQRFYISYCKILIIPPNLMFVTSTFRPYTKKITDFYTQ